MRSLTRICMCVCYFVENSYFRKYTYYEMLHVVYLRTLMMSGNYFSSTYLFDEFKAVCVMIKYKLQALLRHNIVATHIH